jgi:hypothetical protein
VENNDYLRDKTINLNNSAEVEEWCALLNCEKEHLITAIIKIGPSAKLVDDYLFLNRMKKENNAE